MDLTPVVKALISLAAVVMTAVIIPYVKTRTNASQQAEIFGWVQIAVAAAEQLYKGMGRGQEKKDFVMAWLGDRNIKIDMKQLDAFIEAAVYEMNRKKVASDES